MAEELRKKQCYWDVPGKMDTIRLESDGPGLEVHTDDKGRYYVVEDDGERTYIVFG